MKKCGRGEKDFRPECSGVRGSGGDERVRDGSGSEERLRVAGGGRRVAGAGIRAVAGVADVWDLSGHRSGHLGRVSGRERGWKRNVGFLQKKSEK